MKFSSNVAFIALALSVNAAPVKNAKRDIPLGDLSTTGDDSSSGMSGLSSLGGDDAGASGSAAPGGLGSVLGGDSADAGDDAVPSLTSSGDDSDGAPAGVFPPAGAAPTGIPSLGGDSGLEGALPGAGGDHEDLREKIKELLAKLPELMKDMPKPEGGLGGSLPGSLGSGDDDASAPSAGSFGDKLGSLGGDDDASAGVLPPSGAAPTGTAADEMAKRGLSDLIGGGGGMPDLSSLMGGGGDTTTAAAGADTDATADAGAADDTAADDSEGSGIGSLLGGGGGIPDFGSLGGGSGGLASLMGGGSDDADASADADAGASSGGSGASSPGCAGTTIIYARGTGEMGDIGNTVGPGLKRAMGSGTDFQGVKYPASAAGNASQGGAGGGTMASMAKAARSKCPNTKLVLAGYSQGAMVVHNALGKGAPADLAVGFGDPMNGMSFKGVPKEKSLEVCAKGDFLCSRAGGDIQPSGSHLSYGGTYGEAAKWIKSH
ncbi:hypothetical protein MBLNU230_g4639t1 [Neophaeotheca triangularis]